MHLLRLLGAAALLCASSTLMAQTPAPSWKTNRTGTNTYPTQAAALAAVRALGLPADYVDRAYPEYLEVEYVYDQTPAEVIYGDPYNYRDQYSEAFATEAAAVANRMAIVEAASDGCGVQAFYPTTEWGEYYPWNGTNGGTERQKRIYEWDSATLVGEVCRPYHGAITFYRTRTVTCPEGMSWGGENCVRRDVARITGSSQPCSECDLRGNPINVSTGDKYQREQDFTLPWLSFSRHYHSGISVPGGGMGTGWTHDLNITVSEGHGAIVILPHGGQLPFKWLTTEFEAVDGSGWRMRREDGLLRLYQPSQSILFDSQRRASVIELATGETLQLAYDAQGRLASVTHSSGRAIALTYGPSGGGDRLISITADGVELVAYEYDSTGRLEYARYPGGTARRYHYENVAYPEYMTGISDETNVRFATFGYDAGGKATLSEHAGGVNRSTFAYNSDGSTTFTDAMGKVEQIGFKAGGHYRKINSSADSAGAFTTDFADFNADFRRRPNFYIDKRDFKTSFYYEDVDDLAMGAVRKKSTTKQGAGGAAMRTTEEWRDQVASRLLKVVTETNETVYTRNARGQVVSTTVTDKATSATRTSTTTYCEQTDGTCPLGKILSLDGPRTDVADITTFTYYAADHTDCATSPATCAFRKGDLHKVTNALAQVTETLSYDAAGRPLSIKEANGVITDLEYHARGWLTARKVRGTDAGSEADDQITRIEYHPTGQVKKTILPDGSFTTFTYDAAHRLTDVTDAEGNRIHYTLDAAGNRTKEETFGQSGPALRTLSRVYNQLGELQTQKDAFNNATGLVHDANGNVDTVTDALGRVSDNDYDPLNRLSKSIQNLGGINANTEFKYDAQDNLTEVTDPKGLKTKYTYNGFGDLTRLESPDTGVTTYTYDSAGNRKTQTDARGITATYGYDALNRLTSVTYPTASLSTTYSYDVANGACATDERFSKGQLTRILNGYSDTQYCYNRFGQLTRKQQSTNGKTFTVRYGYTRSGNLSSVIYPDGTVADYVRDELGRTFEVGVTRPGGARQKLLTAASYYPFGPAQEWVFGNGRLFQRTLNQNYQPGVVQDQSAGGLSFGYEFDGVGNLVTLRDGNQAEPPKRKYQYDALNRLTQSSNGSTESLLEAYTYDATGNRLSVTDNGVTSTYTMAGASHRLFNANGLARGYDAVGNTTSIGGTARQFTYDDANRMNYVKRNGVGVQYYAYNGKGEQVRRYYSGSDNVYTVYDEAGQWLGEYDNAGNPVQQVIWLDNLPVGLLIGAASANKPLHYIEADALGTPRRIIETGRDVAVWNWPLTGEAFGNDAPIEDSDGDGVALVFNLRFPGQRYDAASGLNYNYFRDYDPSSGKYVQSDPIGLDGGISTYSYAMGNGLAYIDPLGLETRAQCVARHAMVGRTCGGVVGSLVGGTAGATGGTVVCSPGGPAALACGGAGAVEGAIVGGMAGSALGELIGSGVGELSCSDEVHCTKATPWQLKVAGIKDGHKFKTEYGAVPNSRFDICACEDGSIIIKEQGKCGVSGPSIPTFERWK